MTWPDGDFALNYGALEFPASDSPRVVPATEGASPLAERADPLAEQPDQPSGESTLPLLRLSGWEPNKQYDKNNPECMHYDFRWKVSQRENIRARHVCSDTDPDLVLAPSDFWKVNFQARLEALLKDSARVRLRQEDESTRHPRGAASVDKRFLRPFRQKTSTRGFSMSRSEQAHGARYDDQREH